MGEDSNAMKCPFRPTEHGGFYPCYGDKCMAYYEYEKFQFSQDGTQSVGNPVKITVCKRLAQPITYGCT